MKQNNYKDEVMTFAERTEHNAVATDQNPLHHAELYKTNRRSVSEPCELVSEGEAVGDSASIHLIKNHDEAMNKTLSIGQSINNLQSLKIDSDFRQNDVKAAAFILAEGAAHANMSAKFGRCAFTLAEVLITLGIIGIVAAMTIPTLISKYKEKATAVKLKKAYSTISNAYKLAIYENGTPDEWLTYSSITEKNEDGEAVYTQTTFDNYDKWVEVMSPYLKVFGKCKTTDTVCEYQPNATIYNMHGAVRTTAGSNRKDAGILLSDGIYIQTMQYQSSGCNATHGTSNELSQVCGNFCIYLEPGSESVIGKNVFYFWVTKNGIIPHGTKDETTYSFSNTCNISSTDNHNGYGCAAWVIYNENMDYLHCDGLSWDGKHKCNE